MAHTFGSPIVRVVHVAGAAAVSAVCRHDRRPPDRLPPPPVWSHHVDIPLLLPLSVCLAVCLPVFVSACLPVSLSLSAVCRSVGLFVLFPLSCPAAPPALQRGLRRWAAAWLPRARGTRSGVGFTPLPERGSAGALREEGRGDQVVGAWADYDIRLTRLHARPWVGSSLLWVALHRCR